MANKFLTSTNGTQQKSNGRAYEGQPVTETLTNGFFTVDHKWNVKYWNKAAEKLLGVAAIDIIGKNIWEKFAGVIPLEFYAVYQKAFLQDIPVHFEEYWGEMGSWFDVITYHCDDTLSVSFKSSNHPHSEYPDNPAQRLKILTELYRFVTEITNDCLWEWNLLTHEIFWIDGGHKRIFGYQVENALIPQNFWESCIHPDDMVRIMTRLNKILEEGSSTVWEDEYRFKKANGRYSYVHDRGHIIYDDDKRASRMIGATQDITEKVLLEDQLIEERNTKQREITEAVLSAQENERADIGKSLYDNLNQILAATKMYIHLAKASREKRDMYLDKSTDSIMDVMSEITRISKTLVIPGLVLGLTDRIRNLVSDINLIDPITINFNHWGFDERLLNQKLQMNIFRIIQEQLNNILRHAKASHATINLSRFGNKLILLIADNGQGCEISKENKGVGIINIMSRASLYNGTVDIVSSPGKGYDMRVVIPYLTAIVEGIVEKKV
ncbi:MAG: PAS domain-containing protein [Ferruginibacter sp.]